MKDFELGIVVVVVLLLVFGLGWASRWLFDEAYEARSRASSAQEAGQR